MKKTGLDARKIRVMHVYKYLYDGGTEKYMHTLMRNMDPQRYEFSICCLIERGGGAERFERDEFPIYVLDVRRQGGPGNTLHNIRQLLRLARLLKQKKIDILHSHDNFPSAYARLAALLARTPLVYVTYHNIYSWLSPLHHRLNRLLALITTRIVTVSHSVKEWSLAEDRIADDKYRVILNGIEASRDVDPQQLRQRYRREFSIDDNTAIIGNVATLSIRKGQSFLIEALSMLLQSGDNAAVIIVGSEREEEAELKAELEALAARLGVTNHIIYAGSRDDVLDMLYAFDIFAMPSITEGFGLALAEALCAEIPTVVSDIEVFKEITRQGKYALLSRVGDSEDLAEKLRYALSNPEEMKTMAHQARDFARIAYSREKMVESYEKLYAEDISAAG